MTINSINSPIVLEINWVYGLVFNALKPNQDTTSIQPPQLPEELQYSKYLLKVNPTVYERLILALAHCFQLMPGFFRKLQLEELNKDTGIDSFGLINHTYRKLDF